MRRWRPDRSRRIEPWLARRAHPGAAPGAPPTRAASPAPAPGGARWRGLLLVAALLLIVLLLWLRQPLSDWLWPDTRIQQLRSDAALALQAGQLSRRDGRGARELFEAALALDPDRLDARDGLAQVGQAALAQARVATEAGRYADAHRRLQLARELAVPRAQADAVAERLRQRQFGRAEIAPLLARADAARAAGRLDGDPAAALPLYQQVLALEPTHTGALEAREDTLADLLQRAREVLARGALAEAHGLIHRVQAVDRGHIDLPAALAELTVAIDRQLRDAGADLRRGRLIQAQARYRDVLALEPDHAAARQGLVHVANAHARRSERHAADFRFVQADAALREAAAIAPDAPAVLAAAQHLARARLTRARLDSEVPAPARRLRVRQLLAEAAAAEARGDLLTPPGASAFDKVRAARALAPQDPAVHAAAARLAPAARRCFEQALRGNRLTAAGACLATLEVLDAGDSAALRNARRSLASRWIGWGDERLGAGELAAAQAALKAARAQDPGVDGLEEFASRVRAATMAVD